MALFSRGQSMSLDSFESLYKQTQAKQILLFGEFHELEYNEEFYDVFIEKLGKENEINTVFIEQSPSYYLDYQNYFYFDFHLWEGVTLFPIDMEFNIPFALKSLRAYLKSFEAYDIKKYRELNWVLDSLDFFNKSKKKVEIQQVISFTKRKKNELIHMDPRIYHALSCLCKTYEVFGDFKLNRLRKVNSESFYVKREQVILHNYRTVLSMYDSLNALSVMGSCHVYQSENKDCYPLLHSFATDLKFDEEVKITSVQVSFYLEESFTPKSSLIKNAGYYYMELDPCLGLEDNVTKLDVKERYHIYSLNSTCAQFLIISNTLYKEPEDN